MPSTAAKRSAAPSKQSTSAKSAPVKNAKDEKAKDGLAKNAKNALENHDSVEKSPNGIMTKFLLLLIIILLASMPVIMIKLNVRGIGEQLRPIIEDIKYLNKILPAKPDPNDPQYMSKSEVIEKMNEYKGNYEKAMQEIDTLSTQLREYDDVANLKVELEQQKQTYDAEQKALIEERDKLQERINEFSEEVKNADAADFRRFYEEINPELAAQFYERILGDEKADENVTEYVTHYEKMEQAKAAEILENLYTQNSALTVQILKRMNRTRAAQIIALIPTETATNIAERLAEEFSVIN